jgi:tetratricopeptide (TPR) repeat protein
MSYIHKALKKAQREKDSRYQKYGGILSVQREDTNRFSGRAPRWISLAVIVSLLAFACYSWFDSKDQPPPKTEKGNDEKPSENTASNKPAAPVKEMVARDIIVADTKGLYDKARAFHKSGRLKDAKELYQETLKRDPGYVDALNNLGVLYIQDKDYKAARSSFEKAIRFRPEQVNPYYNLACVCALMGETKPAIDHLRRACSLDGDVKKWAREDTDLDNLRGMPEFEEIIGVE